MPLPRAGQYSITSSVAEGDFEDHKILHWQNDCVILESQCTSIAAGLAGVPMQSIGIKRVEVMKLKSLELEHQYEGPSSWWQHVPVAHSLIELTKPNLVVELGSHYGVSFFSFCEAAEKYSRDSLIYAIDTWEGDKQAGFYGDDVYRKVRAHAELNHIQRARLIRCRFEEAVEQFKDKSIDLLHIDGLHT